jgi:hypothetical protein
LLWWRSGRVGLVGRYYVRAGRFLRVVQIDFEFAGAGHHVRRCAERRVAVRAVLAALKTPRRPVALGPLAAARGTFTW